MSSIKRLLQREANFYKRKKIISELKKKYNYFNNRNVKNFYMNVKQIKKLFLEGHEIGLHGIKHYPLNSLIYEEKKSEINDCFAFWKRKKLLKKNWSFCYPFGIYDIDTINILRKMNCNIAITTDKSKIKINKEFTNLQLSRIDTNELFEKLK